MTTILNSGTGITLSSAFTNPVLVTGTISAASGAALYGPGGATTNWTVASIGRITGATYGISLNASGTITNAGSIAGGSGVSVNVGVGTVANAGTITGTKAAGVVLGSIRTPASDGMIINVSGALVTGASYGVFVHGYGSVLNMAGGTIASGSLGVGVGFANGWGTLSNAGTIIGGANQDAVLFFGVSTHNRLIATPGGVFAGKVNGGYGVLELAANASVGTMAGFGSSITNFSTLSFDPGAAWSISGSTAGLAAFLAIDGFTSNDTISLTSFAAVSDTFASNALILTNAANAHATLHIQGSFNSSNFAIAAAPSGSTRITLAGPRSFTWTAGSGDWNTSSGWSLGSVPTAIDSAVIDDAGGNIISIGAGETETINGVTIASTDTMAITGTLAANAIVDDSVLLFVGSHTFAATPLNLAGTLAVQGGTLTIGVGETIVQSGVAAAFASTTATGDGIINQGTISAAIGGGALTIAPLAFINQGVIVVVNEALTLGGTWSNSGAISLVGTAALTLGGQLNTAGLGTFSGTPSVTLAGTLNNAGATLTAVGSGRTFGTVKLTTTGLLSGGTIADAAGTGFAWNGGTLSGVTYQGPLNLTANGATLNVANGLTIGTISLTGAAAQLDFLGSQTLDATTLAIGNATDAATIQAASPGGTLTFASNATIISASTGALATLNIAGNRAVLDGTLQAIASGGSFAIAGGIFENDGTVIVGNGDSLSVTASGTGSGTIDLASHATAGFAAPFAAGQTLAFADATGTLALASPATFAATLRGFTAGDSIDLPHIAATAATWQAGTGKLSIVNGTTPVATLSLSGDYSTSSFTVSSDHAGGSAITVAPLPCFAAGTRILTPRGEVPVERLREGDLLLTASSVREPIHWLGQRDIDCRSHSDRWRALPIRIAPHAFGEGRPKRPLLLSPDHAVFVEGVLIPIRFLLNRTTIRQIELDTVSYFHIELAHHALLLANGLPAESYLDTGGRGAFANVEPPLNLNPVVAPDLERVALIWETSACAPLFGANGEVDRARRKLAVQAALIGA